MTTTPPPTFVPPAKICAPGGKGVLLPLTEGEQHWDSSARGFIYLLLMAWCFLGVACICDVFMEAIEAVTSKKTTIRLECGKRISCKVWNDTVSNLSLMALGSSAPEIMLNVVEIVLRDFYSGDLGPSTIVGSAAFNLMVIIAVCVFVIPEGESRSIKAVEPFMVTAFFSIFAYLWMVFCISISSPDIITVTEAFITLSFFPILITLAYLADVGWFTRKKDDDEEAETMALIKTKALEAGYTLTENDVKVLARLDDYTSSWAEGRVEASPVKAHIKEQDLSIGFVSARYCFTPGSTQLVVTVEKFGSDARLVENTRVAFEYRTTDGNNMRADDGDYAATQGRGEIPAGETYGEIIVNRKAGTPGQEYGNLASKKAGDAGKDGMSNMHFFIDLITADKMAVGGRRRSVPSEEEDEPVKGVPLHIAPSVRRTQVSIAEQEGPGKLKMERNEEDVPCPEADTKAKIKVRRVNGYSGEIACSFFVADGTARNGIHYLGIEGELVFANGVVERTIEVPILKKLAPDTKDIFMVSLSALDNNGRQNCLVEGQTMCTVTIHDESAGGVDAACQALAALEEGANPNDNWIIDNARDWADQFIGAFSPNGSDDDAEEASVTDWTLHIFSLPWKILCAFVPPPSYCGGWMCFYSALLMIGGVTIIIGDLATLLGCVMEINSSITAITIVALGTSLPDTFASKVAAVDDPTADAAIGNVTGSNSVNVFLGLGLPWVIGSLYWLSNGKTEEWKFRYPEQHAEHSSAELVVLSGDLTFSVSVFTLCAVVVLTVLMYRRKAFEAELGGPVGPKTNTTIFFVLLWMFYVSMASWKVINGNVSTAKCIQAIVVGILCVLLGNVLVAGSINYLWFREEQKQAQMKELIHEIHVMAEQAADAGIRYSQHRASQAPRQSMNVPGLKAGQRLSVAPQVPSTRMSPRISSIDAFDGSTGSAGGMQCRGPLLDSRTEELLAAVPKLAEGLRLKLPQAILSLRQHLEALNVVCTSLERGMGGGYRPMINDDPNAAMQVPPLQPKDEESAPRTRTSLLPSYGDPAIVPPAGESAQKIGKEQAFQSPYPPDVGGVGSPAVSDLEQPNEQDGSSETQGSAPTKYAKRTSPSTAPKKKRLKKPSANPATPKTSLPEEEPIEYDDKEGLLDEKVRSID